MVLGSHTNLVKNTT